MKKMLRRDFLSLSAIGIGACLASPLQIHAKLNIKKNTNILFIPIDDLRVQLGCYGRKDIISPNIDKLAETGLLFERDYCQMAICSPSRISLLTGMRPDSPTILELVTFHRDKITHVVTMPQHFKQNGFYSVGRGKIFHANFNKDELSWSEPWSGPKKAKQYNLQENIEYIEKRKKEGKEKGLKGKKLRTFTKGPALESADVPDNKYPDGDVLEQSIDLLRKLKNRRFFLAAGFVKPHLPFNCPKKYWDMYDRKKIRPADNPFAPKGAPEYAMTDWGELRSYKGMPKTGPVPDDDAKKLIHGYNACVTYTDTQVGKLLKELKTLKLEDKTIVILWGDHGWKLGEHGGWCKHTNFELDAHVPMIIRVPGMKTAGSRCSALVEFVDIFPTLCELAGIKPPDNMEGTSFVPLIDNPRRKWKQAAFSQYKRSKKDKKKKIYLMGYSMATEQFRYTEWLNKKTGKPDSVELYNHKKDPSENINIANNPENKEIIKRLSRLLDKGKGWKKNKKQ